MLKIRGYYRTDTGKSRPHNEDRLCAVPEFDVYSGAAQITIDKGKGILFAIADGMGGTNAGEVAAEIAIDTVRSSVEKIEAILLRPAEIGKGLESIIYKAHLNIKGALNEENAGMGTTLILLLITGNSLYVAWCGDSRAYKYSPAIIERKNKYDLPHLKILTHDHSVVWDMVRKGKLDPNAAREHELSNVITQSLGDPSNEPKPESAMYTIAAGDKILVCSDGLNSMLPDEFIQEFLAHEESIDKIGNSLIEAANTEGGHDNISVILAQIDSVPEIPVPIAKLVKERPEAITAKSNISAPNLKSVEVVRKGLMNEPVLIFIFLAALLILAYLLFESRDKVMPVLPDEQKQIQTVTPVKTDSIEHPSTNDTIQKGQLEGLGDESNTTKKND